MKPSERSRVTERDREHFRKIAAFEAANAEDERRAHEKRTGGERLAYALAISRRFRGTPGFDRSDDDPGALYERAKKLGLYRP
jgi:hypothetical protein